jgi:hypothetical protein
MPSHSHNLYVSLIPVFSFGILRSWYYIRFCSDILPCIKFEKSQEMHSGHFSFYKLISADVKLLLDNIFSLENIIISDLNII